MLAVACGMVSCSDSEDTTPSFADVNGFAPSADDNSEDAQLRRDFKDKTGSYLLFTDTLSKKQVSVDAFGKPVYDVELVDVTYVMMGYNDNTHRCTYKFITDRARKKKAAAWVAEKLGARLGTLSPYSIMLVDSISQWVQNDDLVYELYRKNPHPHILLGTRCYAVSLNGDDAFEEDSYFTDVMEAILNSELLNKSAQLKDYWAPVENLISKYKDDLGYDLGYNDDLARQLGFLNDWNKYFFCTKKENDLKDYVHAVCTQSEASFEEEYAAYPVCIQRFKALRTYLLSEGVVLDN